MKLLFFFLVNITAFCQNYTVSGTVRDTAKIAVPLANIFTQNGEGTLTNENGEFVLKVNSLPAQLIISHVSYQTVSLNVTEAGSFNVILREGIKTLPEVKVGNYAWELLQKTMAKVNDDSVITHFGKGFYRKIQTEGNKYTVLHEMFFNTNLNGKYGVSEWEPVASRYTLHDGNVENRSTIYYSLNNSSPSPRIQFRSDSGIMPLNELPKHYSFEIENYINENSPEEIAVIICTPKQVFETAFAGRFYIKTASSAILRVKGRRGLSKKNWPSNFWFSIKETFMEMDVHFREDEEGGCILLGMEVDYVIMAQYASSVTRKITDRVQLIMYEFEERRKGESTLKDKVVSESQIFATTQASPEFWQNNPVIKRTPLEDEVIKAFEKKKKKGGNMFPTQK